MSCLYICYLDRHFIGAFPAASPHDYNLEWARQSGISLNWYRLDNLRAK